MRRTVRFTASESVRVIICQSTRTMGSFSLDMIAQAMWCINVERNRVVTKWLMHSPMTQQLPRQFRPQVGAAGASMVVNAF